MSRDEFFASHSFGRRGEQFEYLADCLLVLKRPVMILETGSLRPGEIPENDGQSTLVWDWVASETGGRCFTIDIDPDHSAHTRKQVGKSTTAVTGESLHVISSIAVPHPALDLVYLDSRDWTGSDLQKWESSLHHAGELAAVWPHVADGGYIAVDDCCGQYRGKQALIECFFNLLEIPPVMTGPIYAWRKPCPQR